MSCYMRILGLTWPPSYLQNLMNQVKNLQQNLQPNIQSNTQPEEPSPGTKRTAGAAFGPSSEFDVSCSGECEKIYRLGWILD